MLFIYRLHFARKLEKSINFHIKGLSLKNLGWYVVYSLHVSYVSIVFMLLFLVASPCRLHDIEDREDWPSLDFRILDGLMVNLLYWTERFNFSKSLFSYF